MAATLQVRGVGHALPKSTPPIRVSQFEAILQESEQQIAASATISEVFDYSKSADITALSSLHVNANSMFVELKERLVHYYQDAALPQPRLHPEKSKAWKHFLYNSLHRLLAEVIFTEEKEQQETCLLRVFQWYYEKVKRPMLNAVVDYPVSEEPADPQTTEQPVATPSEERLRKYSRRQIFSATHRTEATMSRPGTANLTATRGTLPLSRPMTAASRPMTASGPLSAVSRPGTALLTGIRKSAWGENTVSTSAFTGVGDPSAEPRAGPAFSSTYVHFTPFESEEDQKAEERIQAILSKDQGDERLAQEMREKVYSWSVTRARQEEELTRRTEGNRFASRFESRGLLSRPRTALPSLKSVKSVPSIDLTKDPEKPVAEEAVPVVSSIVPQVPYFSDYEKVNRVRKMHGKLIEATDHHEFEDFRANETGRSTLSAYQNAVNRPKTAVPRPLSSGALSRPMSAVTTGLGSLQNYPISDGRLAQMAEINEVKSKLALRGVAVDFGSLSAALLVPEDLPPARLTAQSMPDYGAKMMIDPFSKLGKKKKKKKKLKRKGKGKGKGKRA